MDLNEKVERTLHAIEVLTECREHVAYQGVEAVYDIIDAMIAEREALISETRAQQQEGADHESAR